MSAFKLCLFKAVERSSGVDTSICHTKAMCDFRTFLNNLYILHASANMSPWRGEKQSAIKLGALEVDVFK